MKLSYYKREYKSLLRLGIPITIAQLGMVLQSMADTLMLGQHSASELAAAGFVNSLLLLAQLLSMGFCMAAVPIIGSLYGQQKTHEITVALKSSLLADMLQGLFVCSLMAGIYLLLPYMGLDASLLPLMQNYYIILLPSLLVMSGCTGMKSFMDSINDTRTTMWIVLVGNLWNIVFNYLLIFGKFGFSEMGIDGAAWATSTSRVLMLAIYIVNFAYNKRFAKYRAEWKNAKISLAEMKRQNNIGWPIALQIVVELAAFSGVTLLLGKGGVSWDATTALSSHQVTVQLASFIYMFYLGIGTAVSIRVSNHYGQNNWQSIKDSAYAGYHMILAVGIINTSAVFMMRHHITGLFISDSDPEALARISATVVSMVLPLVFYQVGDGIQTCFVNALRGIGDVKKLLKYSFIAYGVISIPLSYTFGIAMDGGACGIWWGFPFGLSIAGYLYFKRFKKHLDEHL